MLSRIGLCVGLLVLLAPLAGCKQGPTTVANAESCDHAGWGYLAFRGGHFGTTNACNTPISIWFMARNGSVFHSDVPAGAVFDSGLGQDEVGDSWAAATCPIGFAPDPALSGSTFQAINESRYSCAREAPQ